MQIRAAPLKRSDIIPEFKRDEADGLDGNLAKLFVIASAVSAGLHWQFEILPQKWKKGMIFTIPMKN